MKISINIVTWNSMKYLEKCLNSIFSQTFRDFSVLIIDNGSRDGTVEFVRENYNRPPKQATVLQNFQNLGFSCAHNQGIKLTESEYILVTNPDIILEKNFLENLLNEIEAGSEIGSAGGKLLRVYFKDQDLKEPELSDIIDSIGLKPLRSRQVVNVGEGEKDKGQYNKIREVFGISGALALYRREALEDVKLSVSTRSGIKEEYFDESFFSYKEDIDLAWRLCLRGWKSIYTPEAKAYHWRAIQGGKRGVFKVFREYQKRSRIVNFYSYKNHLLTILKNEFLGNFLKDFPFIFFHEFQKFFYILFFESYTLKALFAFFGACSEVLIKRRKIMKRAKVTPKEMRKWFV